MRAVVKEFVENFLFQDVWEDDSDDCIFLGDTAKGAQWQAVRRTITDDTYAVYARKGKMNISKNVVYSIIAVVKYGKREVRFFDSDVFHSIFNAKELNELKALSGKEFLSFEQVVNDMMSALHEENKKAMLYPLPGSVENERFKDEKGCKEHVIRRVFFPNEDPGTDELRGSLHLLGQLREYKSIPVIEDGFGLFIGMAHRWLGSVTDPNYPHFDMQREWKSFLDTVDSMVKKELANPNSIIKKCLDMENAVKGHETVKIDFKCVDGSIESLDVKASAFGYVSNSPICTDDPTICFNTSYVGNIADLDAIAPKLTGTYYKGYDYDLADVNLDNPLWIFQDDIVAIHDGDKLLWSLS